MNDPRPNDAPETAPAGAQPDDVPTPASPEGVRGGASPEDLPSGPTERDAGEVAARPAAGTAPRALGYLAAAAGGGLLVGLLLLATGTMAVGGGGSPSPDPTGSLAPSPSTVPSASPTASAAPAFVDGQVIGRVDAPVTITIWADYQCPFCRLEAFAFGGALEREYAGSGLARIVFRDYAFLGQESLDAAVAARCAGRQDAGGYWRYHDLLFLQQQGENQGAFARQNLVSLAGFAGLDAAAFTTCLDDPAMRQAVLGETAAGSAQGVTSTPTTIISGPGPVQVLRGFTQDWNELAEAVERAANPAATPTPTPVPTQAPIPTPTASPASGASPGSSAPPSAIPPAEASPTPSP